MATTLEQILASTSATLGALRSRRAELEQQAGDVPIPVPFLSRFSGEAVALVAEVKRRSPSAGSIREDLDPVGLAGSYAAAGAAAISVLTDERYFGGTLADLGAVARAVEVPVLRKDFVLSEEQVLEARIAGAAASLLIVRALGPGRLGSLLRFTWEAGLEALVEAHTADEVRTALDAGARVVGVNSRDLDTFTIDQAGAWKLFELIPPAVVGVAESGMATRLDVQQAALAGADAVLIGSALSGSDDPAAHAASLSGVRRFGR